MSNAERSRVGGLWPGEEGAAASAGRALSPQDAGLPAGLVALVGVALVALAGGLYVAPEAGAQAIAAAGLGGLVAWTLWRRPELGVIALLAVTSGFLDPDALDLRLPFGGLDLRDLLLLGLLGLVFARKLLSTESLALPWWPVSGPLLGLMAIGALSALDAIGFRGVEPNWALGELRAVAYYAAFIATVWAIRKREQMVVLLAGFFLIADLTAAVIVAQQFGGQNTPLANLIGGEWVFRNMGEGSAGFGRLRVVPAGHALAFFASVFALALLIGAGQSGWRRAFFAAQVAFLNFALVLTYTRAQWLASLIAVVVMALLVPRAEKARLAKYLAVAGLAVGLVLFGVAGSGSRSSQGELFLDILAARAGSLLSPSQTIATDSLQWRVFESEQSLLAISAEPVLGVGLGNSYRGVTLLAGEAGDFETRLTRYVHNSYLYVATKMGLLGLSALLWFLLAFLVGSWRLGRRMAAGPWKSIAVATFAGFVGFLQWSFTHAHFMHPETTATIGALVGVVACLRLLERGRGESKAPLSGGDAVVR